jgi:hypothetical protein
MSIYSHHFLACLWLILIAAELWLWMTLPIRRLPTFFAYCLIVATRSLGLFYFSARRDAPNYYDLFWTGEWLKHALVGLMLLFYAARCARTKLRLPRSFQWTAALVAITLMGTVTLLRWHEQNPDGSAVLSAEQYVTLWMCGLLILCHQCNSLISEYDLTHAIMEGFVVLYSVNMVTSACRVYYPVTMVQLWFIDMSSQLAVTLWWTWKVRNS